MKYTNTVHKAQKPPHTKKTLDWRLALPGPLLTMYGVAYAIAQLRSQLEAVVMDRPFALAFNGNFFDKCQLRRQ